MRVPARNQRQVDTGYVNEQGHGDTEEAHPKPPIAVCAFPIGTMNMRFVMVIVHDLIHSYPAFLYKYVTEPTLMTVQVCSLAGATRNRRLDVARGSKLGR